MTIRVIVATLTVLGLGVGCTQNLTKILYPDPQVETIEPEDSDADRLLDYYSYTTELRGDPLLREYERTQRLFAEEPSERNRMQLVMLLSSQSAPFRNTNAAKDLLQIWLGDESSTHSTLRP